MANKNRKKLKTEGSFKVKLISVSTPEEAQEALETAIRIIIGNVSGNSILNSRKNKRNVENEILDSKDIRRGRKAQ
ncbi:MAG: hypothetical protein PWP21_1527 [Thermosediminibacterales bacterium]|nr:hypothetical protein [Thermosediminibacterales bacterium]